MLLYDSARYAENAYFIKKREPGQQNRSIRQIVADMFALADGMTMSSKKDGIVNIGGFIALRDAEIYRQASIFNILFEGFINYGGMAGRDMGALSQGLYEATEFDYLEARVGQVAYLGKLLTGYGVPVQMPYGGHAIFVDANKILPHIPKEQYRAQTLAVELYLEAGIRGVEIGAIMADRDPDTRENRYPELELVRLAIPRRVYTNNHMEYVAAAMANVFDRRNSIKSGMEIKYEAPILRHFTVLMERAVPIAAEVR
jgi:tryptophanase